MMKSMAWLMYSRIPTRGHAGVRLLDERAQARGHLAAVVGAWIVVSEPSWPVVMAWSMSKAAASRHSRRR